MWLTNSTHVDNVVYNASQVFVCWYLDVHVEDSGGQAVPSATATASYLNGTQAASDLTDENGWIRLTLIEKRVNTTGEFPLGNYTVTADYDIYQDKATVDMIDNQEIVLVLGFVIPEFPSSIILLLQIITATLLALLVKKNSENAPSRMPTFASHVGRS
jgi:hypothetical protein